MIYLPQSAIFEPHKSLDRMNQLTIDLKNGIIAPEMNRQKICRTSYARVVKFVDDKEHVKPEVYEGDLLQVLG